MTHTDVNASDRPPWYLLGAGNMGTLAAHYLSAAGLTPTVLRHPRRDNNISQATQVAHVTRPVHAPQPTALEKTLFFSDGRPAQRLSLPVCPGPGLPPIQRLIVACKTPACASALAGLPLADDVLVLRLQNGLGSLDGLLPAAATLIEVVTTSAVKGTHPAHTLVAENQTWMGTGTPSSTSPTDTPPTWFQALKDDWPGLQWTVPIQHRQWHKLVANAVINPLTALHDLPNGALLEDPMLRRCMADLAREADALLARLDPTWPGHSLAQVEAVIQSTAANTSSMRADMQRGQPTEIDAITGWLLRQAAASGLDLPAHRAVYSAVKARSAGTE